MRYLLLAILFLFTTNLNAQSLEIGSKNIHIGVSSFDNQQSAFAGVSYAHPIKGIITTRFSLTAGVLQSTTDSNVYNKENDSYRYNGVQDKSVLCFVRPSVMAGIQLPISDFNIGLYAGYQSTINNNIDHRFVPMSVVISF